MLFAGQFCRASGSFVVDSIAYHPYPDTGTIVPPLLDDQWSSPYNIGFNFQFYGTTYSQVVIGSNGQLTFFTDQAGSFDPFALIAPDSLPLPDSLLPRNTISAAFRDINPGCGGTITYNLYGTAPNRYFVVTWDTVPLYSSGNCDTIYCVGLPASTCQAVIYEGCNTIDVYVGNSTSCPGWNFGLGFIGLVDSTGRNAVSPPNRGNGTWTAVNEAWRFTPTVGVCAAFSAGPDQSICQNTIATMQAGGTGTWVALPTNPSATLINNPTSPVTTISGFSYSGLYAYVWADSVARDTVQLTVIASPMANAGPDLSYCLPVTGVVTLGGSPAASGGSGYYTYLWSQPYHLSSDSVSNPILTPGAFSGPFDLTVTDSITGCQARDTMIFTAYSPYTPILTARPDTLMVPGESIHINAFAPIGGTYQWSPLIDIYPVAGDSNYVTVTPTTTGLQTYCVTYTEGMCVTSACLTLNVIPVDAGPDQHACLNGFATMAALGSGTWAPLATNPTATTIDTTTSATTGIRGFTMPGTYQYVWTTSHGTDTAAVIVGTTLTIAVDTIFGPSCYQSFNGEIKIHGSGGAAPYTYSWGEVGLTYVISNADSLTSLDGGTYYVSVTDQTGCLDTAMYTLAEAPQIVITHTANTVICPGIPTGSVCIHVSGGYAPYTYVWTNSSTDTCVSNLGAGINDVTVTDARGCHTYGSFSITQETAVSAYEDSVHLVTCQGMNDGHICLVAIGGTGPYRYLWSNSDTINCIANLAVGLYHATVTDAVGCTDTLSYNLVQAYSNIPIGFYVTNVTCRGDSTGRITVDAMGGTPPYSYLWPGGSTDSAITGLAAGTYCVSVTDQHGCISSACDTVHQPASGIQLLLDSLTEADCSVGNDGSITVSATGGYTPYHYLWSNSTHATTPAVTGLAPGAYCVTATDSSGCTATLCDSITMAQQCVWPGDADNNHLVDNNDLLPIGLGYDTAGPARIVQGIVWQADAATDWTNSFTGYTPAVNFKYADCNGDGRINSDDTLAIIQNFGDTHSKTGGVNSWRSGLPAIYAVPSSDTLHAGDMLTVSFMLGDSAVPVSNFYGLAFTYNFDPLVVDSNFTGIDFDATSWIGTSVDKISLNKILSNAGQIKTAVTRINHTSVNGNGVIAVARFRISTQNITTISYGNISSITGITAIDAQGNDIPLNGKADTTVVISPLGIDQISTETLSIQPNPAHDRVLVSAGNTIRELSITDVMGQEVMHNTAINSMSMNIDISAFDTGVYIIQVRTDRGVGTAKLIVER